jgi:hypothetical protein
MNAMTDQVEHAVGGVQTRCTYGASAVNGDSCKQGAHTEPLR